MTAFNMPSHIVRDFERRWATRLAKEAEAWRNARPSHLPLDTVVSRKGHVVEVVKKRAPARKLSLGRLNNGSSSTIKTTGLKRHFFDSSAPSKAGN